MAKCSRVKKTKAKATKKLHKVHNKGMMQKYADLIKKKAKNDSS